MKLRPQFSLRWRDAQQFEEVREICESLGQSMTEFILQAVEGRISEIREDGDGEEQVRKGGVI